MIGLIGKKIGMTHIWSDDGKFIPVTVIKAGPCYIVNKRTVEKDGYNALQIGFEVKKRAIKPLRKYFEKQGVPILRFLKEFRVEDVENYKIGDTLGVDIFKKGERIDLTGWSKGRGFSGGVKRWNWAGGRDSHGSDFHRRVGSAGATTDPGRILKGKTMPGHYGNERVTVKNVEVVFVDPERNLIGVKGGVPGSRNSLVLIKKRS